MRSRPSLAVADDEAVARATVLGALIGFLSFAVSRSALGADLDRAADLWMSGAVWGGAGLGATFGIVTARRRGVRLQTVEA